MTFNAFSQILMLWRKWRRVIDERLDAIVSGIGEARAIDAAKYIVMDGKRFRGFLTVLVSMQLGGRGEDAVDAAVAVELVHAASLALDDIIDADTVRRGRPAAWITYGIGRTVMVSNLLIPLAQRIVAEKYGCKAVERTISAWLSTSLGEVLDVYYGGDELPPETYHRIARLKTGALFRLATELGAYAAHKEEYVEVFGRFGELLGYAYQVADDTVDLARELNGGRVAQTTGYRLFKKLTGSSVERALDLVAKAVHEAEELGSRLPGGELLKFLPRFMAEAMLSEAGLRLG